MEPLGYLPPAEYQAQHHTVQAIHDGVGVLN